MGDRFSRCVEQAKTAFFATPAKPEINDQGMLEAAVDEHDTTSSYVEASPVHRIVSVLGELAEEGCGISAAAWKEVNVGDDATISVRKILDAVLQTAIVAELGADEDVQRENDHRAELYTEALIATGREITVG